jgi:cytochrome c oxidase assembly factor CtaG
MDCEKDMRRARIVRLFYSFPSEPILAAISSAAAILAVAATLIVPKMESHPWALAFTIVVLAASFGFLCLVIGLLSYRTYLEFQRRTFDVSTNAPLVAEFE